MFYPCRLEWTLCNWMPWWNCVTGLFQLFWRTLLARILDITRENASLKACQMEAGCAPASSRPPPQPCWQLPMFPPSSTRLGASSPMRTMPAYVQRGNKVTHRKLENLGNLINSKTEPANSELYTVNWWNILKNDTLHVLNVEVETFKRRISPTTSQSQISIWTSLDIAQDQWRKN